MRRLPASSVDVRKIFWIIFVLSVTGIFFWFKRTRIISPVPPESGIEIIILAPTAPPTPGVSGGIPIGGTKLN